MSFSTAPSSAAPARRRRPQRRPIRAGRPAPPASGALAAGELLRLYAEGHRCFCPDCRAREREREVRRRQLCSTP